MTEVRVEYDGVIEAFRKLNVLQMQKVGYDAFAASLPILQGSAANVLYSEGVDIDSVGKAGKTMRQGITAYAYRDGSGGSVTALGEYKLKWFALGTEDRWQDQKHGRHVAGQAHRYLGAIQPTNFLQRGVEAARDRFYQELEKNITESINRIVNQG